MSLKKTKGTTCLMRDQLLAREQYFKIFCNNITYRKDNRIALSKLYWFFVDFLNNNEPGVFDPSFHTVRMFSKAIALHLEKSGAEKKVGRVGSHIGPFFLHVDYIGETEKNG